MELLVACFAAKDRLLNDAKDGYADIELWKGLKCNDDREIIEVNWREYAANHFPAGGTIDISCIPKSVVVFVLAHSNMQGA
mmetsp:Transcript_23922/g.37258  ORF Transcript_23922/g.37258 Transcript_23922/m.37258 type:complete len:81 (-) Transcript_23922:30-272(-)